MSRKIMLPAMRVVKTGTKGGPHDDVFRYRGIGDFGISVFYGSGWFHGPNASSLSAQVVTLRSCATAPAAHPPVGIVFRCLTNDTIVDTSASRVPPARAS